VRRRRVKITFQEYQHESGTEVTEEELTNWYMEQVEDEIATEGQLYEQQNKVQLIIQRMVEKDRVILVVRPSEDPLRPEGRVLAKHPNFLVGELIAGSRTR